MSTEHKCWRDRVEKWLRKASRRWKVSINFQINVHVILSIWEGWEWSTSLEPLEPEYVQKSSLKLTYQVVLIPIYVSVLFFFSFTWTKKVLFFKTLLQPENILEEDVVLLLYTPTNWSPYFWVFHQRIIVANIYFLNSKQTTQITKANQARVEEKKRHDRYSHHCTDKWIKRKIWELQIHPISLFLKYQEFLLKVNTTTNSTRPRLSSIELLGWKEPWLPWTHSPPNHFYKWRNLKLNYVL